MSVFFVDFFRRYVIIKKKHSLMSLSTPVRQNSSANYGGSYFMKICLIGAGVMGKGIAQVFSAAGHEVALFASSEKSAEKHITALGVSLAKLVAKGKMTQETADGILGRIHPGTEEDAKNAELLVEASPENMESKKAILAQYDAICNPDCAFVTNTSSISITELGIGISRPIAGMHFFNPVPVMKLVEVIEGLTTPPELTAKVKALAESLGKTPVIIKDSPGFVVNRLLIPMINEAIFVLSEGVASAEDIDTAMKLGCSHVIGPLALADLIGLDVVLAIMNVLYEETADSKYRPALLLRQMVRAGKLGRKSGEGFFSYTK